MFAFTYRRMPLMITLFSPLLASFTTRCLYQTVWVAKQEVWLLASIITIKKTRQSIYITSHNSKKKTQDDRRRLKRSELKQENNKRRKLFTYTFIRHPAAGVATLSDVHVFLVNVLRITTLTFRHHEPTLCFMTFSLRLSEETVAMLHTFPALKNTSRWCNNLL